MMTTTSLRFERWVGGPRGHAEEVGVAAFAPDGHAVWVDATLRAFDRDLPHGWYRPQGISDAEAALRDTGGCLPARLDVSNT